MKKVFLIIFTLGFTLCVHAQDLQQTIDSLYFSIGYEGGGTPDYSYANSLFRPNAQLKWITDSAVYEFTTKTFFDILAKQIEEGVVLHAKETEISNRTEHFGKIAQVFSSYKTSVVTPDGPVEKTGINSMQLIQQKGQWKITSLMWYETDPQNGLPPFFAENTAEDREKVKAIAADYVGSIYDPDQERLDGIAQDLYKQGYYLSRKDSTWSMEKMSYDELVSTSASYNKKKWLPANAPREVELLDIDERIANLKVRAIWGFDYLLLVKNDQGEWQVKQILWQSYTFPDQQKMIRKIKENN